MANYNTAAEIAEKNIELLGKDLGQTFTFLHNDFLNLLLEWQVYRAFFGTNKERVDLLNAVSGSTAYIIEKTLFHSVLLGLRRLSANLKGDPNKGEISISKLLQHLEEADKRTLAKTTKAVRVKCAFAKNWADKRIAHSDWSIRNGEAELEIASRKKAEEALQSIAEFIQAFGKLKLDTTYVFEIIKPFAHDEVHFLEVLMEGKNAKENKKSVRKAALEKRDFTAVKEIEDYPDWLKERYQPEWAFKDFDV